MNVTSLLSPASTEIVASEISVNSAQLEYPLALKLYVASSVPVFFNVAVTINSFPAFASESRIASISRFVRLPEPVPRFSEHPRTSTT